jgi:Putative MetA-pathway of phenol degradation
MMAHLVISFIICILLPAVALAGPPFRTDDPEPVEYKHWEVYVASQGSLDRDVTSLTAPHIEINYGILPEVQIHLIAPFEWVKPEGEPSHYGYGDTELGAKFRFTQETDLCPQVGIFPILILPTGDQDKGLGGGETQAFLPLWLQKIWGPWKTYGGGGYWLNPGEGNKNYWFFGWEVQRDLSQNLTLGVEIFHQTRSEEVSESSTGFNVGGIINFNDLHHLLFSAGRNFSGPNDASFYIAYQLTFGP